ncbi:MAG: hypothetical protein AB1798_01850 [Spirochaetota bacterium]
MIEPEVKTIIVDGSSSDWGNMMPVLVDPTGDVESDARGEYTTYGTDLVALFVAQDDSFLYWRMDLADGSPNSIVDYKVEFSFEQAGNRILIHEIYSNFNCSAGLTTFDQNGVQLSADPIPEAICAIRNVVEGRIPLQYLKTVDQSDMQSRAERWVGNPNPGTKDESAVITLKLR